MAFSWWQQEAVSYATIHKQILKKKRFLTRNAISNACSTQSSLCSVYLVICYQQANLYILAAHQLGLHLEHTTLQGCLSAIISHWFPFKQNGSALCSIPLIAQSFLITPQCVSPVWLWVSAYSTYLRSGVHHIHEGRVGVGLTDGLKHLLVLQTPGAESGQRLAAATDSCLQRPPQQINHVH